MRDVRLALNRKPILDSLLSWVCLSSIGSAP